MATSIRDLLQALKREAQYAAGTPRQARDSAGALDELGRALRRVANDGLELDVTGSREDIVRDLAESCAQNAATINRDPSGRLTQLAGGVADVVEVLRDETGREPRWAIAVEISSAVRVISTYAAEGDRRRTADLAWTHFTARALVTRAVDDPPSVQSQAVLDRIVPGALVPPGMLAARAAMESLTVISDRLRRSATDRGRRPSLLEVFAVSRAAESTTRYGAMVGAALAGRPAPDALPASAIWYEVRDRLRPFTTAAPLTIDDRDLGLWAQRAHLELRREFGPPHELRLTRNGQGSKTDAVQHLQMMVNEIPAVADQLARGLQQLADHGELHALASRLPFREQRISEFLTHHPVVADRFEILTVMDRLEDAGKLAAELAVDLDRCATATVGRAQPGLLAAHAARAGAAQIDPHAALVEHVTDGIDSGEQSTSTPRFDLDDVAWNGEPECDVE